jgi:hypothetical protein
VFPQHYEVASIFKHVLYTLSSATAGVHSSFERHTDVFAFGRGYEGFGPDRRILSRLARQPRIDAIEDRGMALIFMSWCLSSNVGKKVILSGACAVLMLSVVGVSLWYTRYRVPEEPEAIRLETVYPPKPFVLHSGNLWCQRAMSAHGDDYIRPVFKLIFNGETLPPTIKLRDSAVSHQDLPAYLEGLFKTRAERTVFLLTSPEIAPRYVDDILHLMRSSLYVNNVCVMDSQMLPPWFPKNPEPRGRL